MNPDLSELGEQQVENVCEQLRRDNFFEESRIDVVLCSPLVRALRTCQGLCEAIDPDNALGQRDVVEVESLKEKTPFEWVPGVGTKVYHARIKMFEKVLSQRPEKRLFVVGHSQFFRTMLGTKTKMRNVDVYVVDFVYTEEDGAKWEFPERLYGTTNS